LAVDVNDSEEIESEEEEDRMNVDMDVDPSVAQNKNVGPQHKGVPKRDPDDEDEDDDEKEVPGAYNPQQFANLPVSSEVKELFEYIQRYKPQKIDLETKLKPFVPEYIPCRRSGCVPQDAQARWYQRRSRYCCAGRACPQPRRQDRA